MCVCASIPRCVCACMRVHVCVHVNPDNLSPVQCRITKFGTEVQNTLDKILIVLELIGVDLQGQIEIEIKIYPFGACPHNKSPQIIQSANLDKTCILALLRSLLIWGLIELDFQFHFYLRPVLTFGYRRCLYLSVCASTPGLSMP